MKTLTWLSLSLILFCAANTVQAVDIDSNSAICTRYANDRNYSGDRYQRSLDVCNSAVDALISMGMFNAREAERDPHSHLNRVCGMNGSTFKLGDRYHNATFLNKLRASLARKGYSIFPNDFESISASLVEGKEADLFISSNFSSVHCSTLLYVLFRIENYFRK